MLKLFARKLTKNKSKINAKRQMLTEDEAWKIWAKCGKLAGVDYYEYATKIIKAYESKNR